MSTEASVIRKVAVGEAQKVCASQVIQSLSAALRQLIDNAIDARATVIDIRCQSNGFESIEVDDNGNGIGEENFENLCKPHATSKLSTFDGLSNLSTLGFRGEALHSLALLAKVTITTRIAEATAGTRLTYKDAEVVEKELIARQIGTTVRICGLFHSLPVRRKEFEKTQKKEFTRVLAIVQEYALLYTNVKFLLSNTINGKRNVMISTPGGLSSELKDVVTSLFGGSSDRCQMIPLKWDGSILEAIQHEYSLLTTEVDFIKLTGFISSCLHGNGRSSTDRQFIYANRRPVDLPKVSRAINEIYQQHNKGQFPVFVIQIDVPLSWIEVNVTPDKRTIFFQDEKLLLASMKSAILASYEPLLGTQKSCQSESREGPSQDIFDSSQTPTMAGGPVGVPSVFDLLRDSSAKSQKRPLRAFHEQIKRSKVTAGTLGAEKLTPFNLENYRCSSQTPDQIEHQVQRRSSLPTKRANNPANERRIDSIFPQEDRSLSLETGSSTRDEIQPLEEVADEQLTLVKEEIFSQLQGIEEEEEEEENDEEDKENVGEEGEGEEEGEEEEEEIGSQFSQSRVRPSQKITLDRGQLFDRLRALKDDKLASETGKNRFTMNFTSEISPEDSGNAERELDQALSKSDFAGMRVIGQFNRGFIITRLDDHLFIVDQHAADEKFNFERFQKSARVGTQKMIRPQPLQLGAVTEAALYDNYHIFEANGFEVDFAPEGAQLVSLPVLTKYQFDRADVDEILSAVIEHPNQMYRPQKLRRIFASRACRTSTMVGDVLSLVKMEEIVTNLGQLDHPWSCPHGRPTLRHLAELKKIDFE